MPEPILAISGLTTVYRIAGRDVAVVQDLGHIADASGVRIELDGAALPVPAVLGPDGRHHVLTGGEDHAFAGTFPPGVSLPASWRVVGRVVEGAGLAVDGDLYSYGGWDHFS